MKTGKYIPLGEYKNVKIGYGTVDFKNLKTVYLKLNSWLQPKKNSNNFDKIMALNQKAIKTIIYENNNNNFKKESIVDLDIRTKGIKLEKRSFMNLEITLYADNFFDIKSKDIKMSINQLLTKIIDDILLKKSPFNFYKTKK